MAIRRQPTVVDQDGVRGHIRELVEDATHTVAAIVALSDDTTVTLPAAALHPHDDGGYAIAARWNDYVHDRAGALEIPVIAEHVTVDVRQRARETVRIRRDIAVEERIVETPLVEERLEVERTAVDVLTDTPPQVRREGDTYVVPVVEQVAVVVTRYRVREELRIRVVRTQRTDRQTVSLRRHEVSVEHDTHSTRPDNPDNPENPEGDRS